MRASLPAELVALPDSEAPADLAADLRVLRDESAGRGWGAAVEGMSRSLASTGGVDRASVALSAARAASGDERAACDEGAGPGACDRALRLLEGGGRHAADELGARGRPGGLPRRREGPLHVRRRDRRLPRLRDAGPGGRVHGDARVGGRPPRDRSRRARPPGQARFPVPRSAEGFDWSNVAFPDGWGRDEMCSLAFVRDAEDLASCGQTGRGKTHMATALGIAATSAGYPVRFWQTAQLVPRLGKAKREGTLDRLLADVAKARLLVLDEFGYVPFDVDGARLPCQVISESYERRGATSATNVESGRWGTVFADDKLAAAIAGRVVHHGRLVEFGGPSHRLEESLMLGKSGR